MGLRINTNIASLNAQRNLATITDRLAVHYKRLSTGLRITSAADDAAGLAISERLRAQVRSLDQAKRNAQDGISLVQTGEGALNEVGDILIRLRELAVQASNGSVSSQDRTTLNDEFQQLVQEVDRIGRASQFNGIHLLDGSSSSVSFQIGLGITSGVDTLTAGLSPVLATSLGLDVLGVTNVGSATSSLTALDSAINNLSRVRGSFGAMQNRLEHTINYLGVQAENLSAAESRIRDVDIAKETAELARDQILQQAAIAVLAQANSQPQLMLRLLGVG
ncbi:MAG: flagellin FliC [Planctomycetes bacterium]|nr:flagellin FliC [Planctomycetota bacterium]MCC7065706.1 flagellin FliC [Planctomycetota bacterium]